MFGQFNQNPNGRPGAPKDRVAPWGHYHQSPFVAQSQEQMPYPDPRGLQQDMMDMFTLMSEPFMPTPTQQSSMQRSMQQIGFVPAHPVSQSFMPPPPTAHSYFEQRTIPQHAIQQRPKRPIQQDLFSEVAPVYGESTYPSMYPPLDLSSSSSSSPSSSASSPSTGRSMPSPAVISTSSPSLTATREPSSGKTKQPTKSKGVKVVKGYKDEFVPTPRYRYPPNEENPFDILNWKPMDWHVDFYPKNGPHDMAGTCLWECMSGIGLYDPDATPFINEGLTTTTIGFAITWPGYEHYNYAREIQVVSDDGDYINRRALSYMIGRHYRDYFLSILENKIPCRHVDSDRWGVKNKGDIGSFLHNVYLLCLKNYQGNIWEAVLRIRSHS